MNIIKIGTDTDLTWEDGKLTSYQQGNNTYSYSYDNITKQRIKKEKNNTEINYYYHKNRLICEEDKINNNYIKYQYDASETLIRITSKVSNTIYKLIIKRDILGNINGLLNEETLEEVISYQYDAYGKVEVSGSNSSISLKPLTFSEGLVTPDNPKLPKWMDFLAF